MALLLSCTRGRSAKFHRPWKGPYIIVKALNDVVYRIRNVDAPRKKLVVHFNRLKLYKHDSDQNDEARSEDNGPVKRAGRFQNQVESYLLKSSMSLNMKN